jgi:hypothetical protein
MLIGQAILAHTAAGSPAIEATRLSHRALAADPNRS